MSTFAAYLDHDVRSLLDDRLRAAASDAIGEPVDDGLVRVSPPTQSADYQSSIALKLGRQARTNPAQLAQRILDAIDVSSICDPGGVEVSGPGFLNFVLSDRFVEESVAQLAADPRLGIGTPVDQQTVIIDYSAPNVAKEMHVGHLRSTIIGDALRRLLLHLGHQVNAANHLGDWGTPFGMLIEYMLDSEAGDEEVSRLTDFYRDARARFDSDESFADRSRARVVELQGGDERSVELWKRLRRISEAYFQDIYSSLGVLLQREENFGESFYNPMLGDVVDELERKGLLEESDGALCMFLPGYQSRDDKPMPIIVRKRDGAYNYDTTDLAALRYRLRDLHATAVLYVVGAPQDLHFRMIFEAGRAAGWANGSQVLKHVAFGSVLGEDGKMLKTRHGKTVKLRDMLDEAVTRAGEILTERGLAVESRADLARAIGIGAVKYADLSSDRLRDYVFDLDRMLAFEGNTAAYIQYARARAESVLDRVGSEPISKPTVRLEQDVERALAIELLRFGAVVNEAAELLEPHRLCTYLYELAALFSRFYEHCPVASAEGELRGSRVLLTTLLSSALATGLGLLGIESPRHI